jgi:hypothetical protein
MKAAYQVNDFILDKKTRRMGTIDRVGFGPFSRLKDGDSSYGTVYYVAWENEPELQTYCFDVVEQEQPWVIISSPNEEALRKAAWPVKKSNALIVRIRSIFAAILHLRYPQGSRTHINRPTSSPPAQRRSFQNVSARLASRF